MKKSRIITTIFLAYVLWRVAIPEYISTEPVRIGAFNIRVFGKAKRGKADVMDVLTKIALEFDILFVQEIRDASGETAPYYLQLMNEAGNSSYEFIRSARLGRTTSKEVYVYFYNNETVDFIEGSDYVFNDANDVFEREPYIASFKSGEFDFTVVGIHVSPYDAYNEIGNLSLVVQYVLENDPNEEDIIVLGDLNADGSYYYEEDTTNPFKAPEFFWVITNEMDTMVITPWTYDRIVMLNTTHGNEFVYGSAGVFYFDVEYGITDPDFVEKVSDHYPIYADFWTDKEDDD